MLAVLRRWCTWIILASCGLLAANLVAAVFGKWWSVAWLGLWTAAAATYGATLIVSAAHHVRVRIKRIRRAARSRRPVRRWAWRHLAAGGRAWWRVFGPILLPVILLTGPLVFVTQWLPVEVLEYGFPAAVGLGFLFWLVPQVHNGIRSLRQAIAPLDLIASMAVWEFVGLVLALQMGWPAPREHSFELLAQIDVALLVAVALVFDVPPAWRPLALTWYAGGLLVVVLGLLAAVAGAVGAGEPHLLFVLSLGPIAPAVVAYLIKARRTLGLPDEQMGPNARPDTGGPGGGG